MKNPFRKKQSPPNPSFYDAIRDFPANVSTYRIRNEHGTLKEQGAMVWVPQEGGFYSVTQYPITLPPNWTADFGVLPPFPANGPLPEEVVTNE